MKKVTILLVCIVMIITLSGCAKERFDGMRVTSESGVYLDFDSLRRDEIHEFEMDKDQAARIEIEVEDGDLDILFESKDGDTVYRADNASDGDFEVTVDEAGTYIFSVSGKKAKGTVKFERIDG